MGCIYSNFNGHCQNWCEEIEMPGCDNEGYCVCEDNPDPNFLCEHYESEYDDIEEEEIWE